MSVCQRSFRLAAVLVALVGTSAVRPVQAQLVAVSVKSTDDALAQVRMLVESLGADRGKPILDELDGLEKAGILNGVDRTRPVLATFELLRQPGAGPMGLPCLIVFVPVTSQDDLLATLKKSGVGVDDVVVDGFTHRLLQVGTGAPPFYILADPPKGYTVATNVPSNPGTLRAMKPAELRPANAGLISAVGRFDKVPPSFKEGLLNNVAQQMAGQRQKRDNESDIEYKSRMAGVNLVDNAFTSLVRDSQSLKLDLNVDPKTKRLALAVELDAKPGSPMAAAYASFAALKSRFHGISPAAAMSLSAVVPITEDIRGILRDGFKLGREEAQKEKDPEDARMFNLVLDALEPTLTGPDIDGCAIMDFPDSGADDKSKSGTNVVLFGFALKESKKLETALRESAAKGAKPNNLDEIVLDAEKGADGTPIHRVKLAADQVKQEGFGEPLMFVAFPEGAAMVAVGGKGLPVIKQALAGLKNPPAASSKPASQVELDMANERFARIYQAQAGSAEVYRKAAATAFAGKNAGKDRLRIGLTVEPTTVRISLDADLPVLSFLTDIGSNR